MNMSRRLARAEQAARAIGACWRCGGRGAPVDRVGWDPVFDVGEVTVIKVVPEERPLPMFRKGGGDE